jgi:hypothetical protein
VLDINESNNNDCKSYPNAFDFGTNQVERTMILVVGLLLNFFLLRTKAVVTNVSCSSEFITVGYHLSSSFYLASEKFEMFDYEAGDSCSYFKNITGFDCTANAPKARKLCLGVSNSTRIDLAYIPTRELSIAVLSQFSNFTLGTLPFVHVGAYNNGTTSDQWYWRNGLHLNSSDPIWASGQPDGSSDGYCGGIAKSFYLADYLCDSASSSSWFLCEVEGELVRISRFS